MSRLNIVHCASRPHQSSFLLCVPRDRDRHTRSGVVTICFATRSPICHFCPPWNWIARRRRRCLCSISAIKSQSRLKASLSSGIRAAAFKPAQKMRRNHFREEKSRRFQRAVMSKHVYGSVGRSYLSISLSWLARSSTSRFTPDRRSSSWWMRVSPPFVPSFRLQKWKNQPHYAVHKTMRLILLSWLVC